MWRVLRISVLLTILAVVGLTTWNSYLRTTQWTQTLRVMVYPVNAQGDVVTARYLETLQASALEPIAVFMQQQAQRHGLPLQQPVSLQLAPPMQLVPPPAPQNPNLLESMLWSLQFRFWAWRHDRVAGPRPHVRVFVLYFPADPARVMPHSVGLRKGMLGLVHAFASREMQAENNVVIAHELLHTFGASDKYDPLTNLPRYPEGYAEPSASPLYPQPQAEIMAGRIPTSQRAAEPPLGLSQAMIGPVTAREIHWMKP